MKWSDSTKRLFKTAWSIIKEYASVVWDWIVKIFFIVTFPIWIIILVCIIYFAPDEWWEDWND